MEGRCHDGVKEPLATLQTPELDAPAARGSTEIGVRPSHRRGELWSDEHRILAALADAPLARGDLRARLHIRNERLGEALTRLVDLGAVCRLGELWAVPESHSRPP